METIKHCCGGDGENGRALSQMNQERCGIFLNSNCLELMFEVIDTLKDQRLTLDFSYMLRYFPELEHFQK